MPPQHHQSLSVLLVSPPPNDHTPLEQILSHSNWQIRKVTTCDEALKFARDHPTAVVVCGREFAGGDWKALLHSLDSLPLRPNLIVTSRLPDAKFWAEVLNLGGYDILEQPFVPEEVYRSVSMAWQNQVLRARQASDPSCTRHMLASAEAVAP